LHGKQVTFRAGSNIPFQVGTNIIRDNSTAIAQFSYNHVGTLIQVTPHIVGWKTKKDKALVPQTLDDLGVQNVSDPARLISLIKSSDGLQGYLSRDYVAKLTEATGVPTKELIVETVNELNGIIGTPILVGDAKLTRKSLEEILPGCFREVLPVSAQDDAWNLQDCTINLEITVRLSEAAPINLKGDVAGATNVDTFIEQNVRAISNHVQVRSGQGEHPTGRCWRYFPT
jgi:hypothetical protein